MIDPKLKSACEDFARSGTVDMSIFINNTLHPDHFPPDHREAMGVLQWAMIANMERTCRCALDQISVCFAVSNVLQFYRDDIVRNNDFWMETARFNGRALNNALSIFNQDIKNLSEYIQTAIDAHNEQVQPDEVSRNRLLKVLDRMTKLAGEGDVLGQRIVHFRARADAGQAYFEPNEKDNLPDGQDAAGYAKSLFARMSLLSEEMLDANEDVLRTKLARAFYISTVLIPSEPENRGLWADDIAQTQAMVEPLMTRLEVMDEQEQFGQWFANLTFRPVLQ